MQTIHDSTEVTPKALNAGPAARNSPGFVPLVPAPPIAVPTVKKGDSAVTEVSTDKLLNRPGLPAGASVIAADALVSRLPLPASETTTS